MFSTKFSFIELRNFFKLNFNERRILFSNKTKFYSTETNGGNKSATRKYNKPPPIDLKSIKTRQQINSKEQENNGFNFAPIFLLGIPLITFGLGVWQIKRREWKLDLINFLESRTKAEPRVLPLDPIELGNLVETSEYSPFKVKGHFIHSKEILLTPRHDLTMHSNKPGGWVITPFILSDRPNLTILVNRGFVPYTNYSPITRKEAQVDNEVELIGLLRSNEPTTTFTPVNNPPNEWHFRDIKQMAQFCGTAPIFLDAIEESTIKGGPTGGQTAINIRNEHTTYIITWFTLSLITSFLWWRRFGRFII